jgi:hypothetical protein
MVYTDEGESDEEVGMIKGRSQFPEDRIPAH